VRARSARRAARTRVARALTIAGSDSGAGAGIQADLKTFAARGVYGTSVVAALTAQNSRGVRAVLGLPAAFVRAQIDAVLEDLGADAVKTGMLYDARTVATVAAALATHRARHVVVDPVALAKGGERLLVPAALRVLRERLLPLAEVVTPNRAEAAALVGFPVVTLAAMEEAARALARLGARAVVVTGGRVRDEAVDLLLAGSVRRTLRAAWVGGAPPHGTGCTFSAAIAAELAKGGDLEGAVGAAKRYTTGCIRRARRIGGGHPVLGHLALAVRGRTR
jgi:hydroxymethylpyrimidine kinase/phosphomethylpyrimidine kinase